MAHTGTLLEPDMGPPPFSGSDPLCGARAREVKIEDQISSSKTLTEDSPIAPWKLSFAVEFWVTNFQLRRFLDAFVTFSQDFTSAC